MRIVFLGEMLADVRMELGFFGVVLMKIWDIWGVWRLGLLPVLGFGRCLGLAVLSGKCTVVVLGCVDCEKRFIF